MSDKQPKVIGWREWGALPALGIEKIKIKMDTGARTSCLHTFLIEEIQREGAPWVRFKVHPKQNDIHNEISCEAPVLDKRMVTDSGGHAEERYVIETLIRLGEESWPIEMTLSNREGMKFRMLLGRTAMYRRLVIDPAHSFTLGERGEK